MHVGFDLDGLCKFLIGLFEGFGLGFPGKGSGFI